MRQRNDTGHVQDVAAWPATDDRPELRPVTVGPGEQIDHPVLIGGFTSLEPAPEPGPQPGGDSPSPEPDADAPSTAASRRTAPKKPATTRTEDGEQR